MPQTKAPVEILTGSIQISMIKELIVRKDVYHNQQLNHDINVIN